MSRALVLAGGGVAGIAWHLGVIEALRAEGIDLAVADLIVGTSAGSVVGAQVATGQLAAAVELQERTETTDIYVDVDLQSFMTMAAELAREATDETDLNRRFGRYAIEAKTIAEAPRKAAVAARLPVKTWPGQPLKLPAVDAMTGELVVFDRDSGVDLVDAVAASCAVPGVWPPVTIGDRRYVDGGTRSFTNADLARGCDHAIIMIPVPPNPLHEAKLARELAVLQATTRVIQVDADAIAAIGPNPLDPSRRKPALDAGRRQGRAIARDLRW